MDPPINNILKSHICTAGKKLLLTLATNLDSIHCNLHDPLPTNLHIDSPAGVLQIQLFLWSKPNHKVHFPQLRNSTRHKIFNAEIILEKKEAILFICFFTFYKLCHCPGFKMNPVDNPLYRSVNLISKICDHYGCFLHLQRRYT